MASEPRAQLILGILNILVTAELAIAQAIHNILTGNGTADDLAILGADKLAWQAIADKAQSEIDKVKAASQPAVPKAIGPEPVPNA